MVLATEGGYVLPRYSIRRVATIRELIVDMQFHTPQYKKRRSSASKLDESDEKCFREVRERSEPCHDISRDGADGKSPL